MPQQYMPTAMTSLRLGQVGLWSLALLLWCAAPHEVMPRAAEPSHHSALEDHTKPLIVLANPLNRLSLDHDKRRQNPVVIQNDTGVALPAHERWPGIAPAVFHCVLNTLGSSNPGLPGGLPPCRAPPYA
ncbi:hypothetical protein [Halomonas sp.]|uniref:hypothetical protein n=1 Tax=Halomonas sp. TaxID=1486246 RepID=UPI003F909AE3